MKRIWLVAWYTVDNEIDKIAFAYVKALENSGNKVAYIIPSASQNMATYIQEMDWFIIPGWRWDVDSTLYGETNQWAKEVDKRNDMMLLEVIRKIIDSWKPLLWICKGMQLINVALWGTLIQDVPDTQYSFDPIHNVILEKNSKVFQIYHKDKVLVNSLHHQAVKEIGKWLRIAAHNEEWIIEAIESDDGNVIGVQRHPEYLKEHECLFVGFFCP